MKLDRADRGPAQGHAGSDRRAAVDVGGVRLHGGARGRAAGVEDAAGADRGDRETRIGGIVHRVGDRVESHQADSVARLDHVHE